jgi:hypothetical protein
VTKTTREVYVGDTELPQSGPRFKPMERDVLNIKAVLRPKKTAVVKRRKRSVSQILREAYERHSCRDRATLSALRVVLR